MALILAIEPKHVTSSQFRSPWLLFVALTLLGGCLYPFADSGTEPAMIIYVSMILSLASLTGVWLGTASKWWRFLVAPFAILAPATVLGISIGNGRGFDWIGAAIAGGSSIIVFVTLEVIKLCFGNFRIPTDNEETADGLQFGIAQLMIATASVAVFISVVKLLLGFVEVGSRPMGSNHIFIASMFVFALAIFTLANVWALMGASARYRIFVSAAVSLLSITPSFYLAPSSLLWTLWMCLFAICWGVIALQLWLLRRSGLRFVRK